MNLKELIKEVERLRQEVFEIGNSEDDKRAYLNVGKRRGIKQTVEAVDVFTLMSFEEAKDWQKLKKLLGLK